MITIIPIEYLNDEHALLVIDAFNSHFIDGGGRPDGYGCGAGYRHGDGHSGGYSNDIVPEEWLINESSPQPADGHI